MRLVKFKSRPHRSHSRSHSRSRGRHYRHNPVALRAILNPQGMIAPLAVGGGFIAGAKLGGMFYNKIFATGFLAKLRRGAGVLALVGGSYIAKTAKDDRIKKAGIGLAASGVYDLAAQNLPMLKLATFSGESFAMHGEDDLDLVGDDEDGDGDDMEGESISVSGDMTELVGDDMEGDRVYAS